MKSVPRHLERGCVRERNYTGCEGVSTERMKSFGGKNGVRRGRRGWDRVKLNASWRTIERHAAGTNQSGGGWRTLHKVRSRFPSFANCATPLEIAVLDRLPASSNSASDAPNRTSCPAISSARIVDIVPIKLFSAGKLLTTGGRGISSDLVFPAAQRLGSLVRFPSIANLVRRNVPPSLPGY